MVQDHSGFKILGPIEDAADAGVAGEALTSGGAGAPPVWAAPAPAAHAGSHEDTGADEISVAALSGLLADDQHVIDAEVLAVAAALLHASRHIPGGADPMRWTNAKLLLGAGAGADPTEIDVPAVGGLSKTRTILPMFLGHWQQNSIGQGVCFLCNPAAYTLPSACAFYISNASLGNGSDECYKVEYDPTAYDSISAVYFEAVLAGMAGGFTAFCELYNLTDAASIAGSEVSHNTVTPTLVRSGDILANMPAAAKWMIFRMKTSSFNEEAFIYRVQLIIEQA